MSDESLVQLAGSERAPLADATLAGELDPSERAELPLVLRRRAFEHNARALRHDVSPREVTGALPGTLVARFLGALPFELTTAQRRALAVIVADLAGPFPMHRLLQADVGAGKTAVAVYAILVTVGVRLFLKEIRQGPEDPAPPPPPGAPVSRTADLALAY